MSTVAKDFRLNRVFSEQLTPLLLRLPVTPNQVTLLSLACGILAGFLFARGTYFPSLWGAACYELACILDNCDGEIARAKNLGSVFGGWLDIGADFLTDLSLFIGIGYSVLKNGAEPKFVAGALGLCLFGTLMHCSLVVLEKYRGFGPAEFDVPHPAVKYRERFFFKFFDALREGDASWLVVAFAAAGKASYLLWFGAGYLQVLWVSALLLNFKHLFGTKK